MRGRAAAGRLTRRAGGSGGGRRVPGGAPGPPGLGCSRGRLAERSAPFALCSLTGLRAAAPSWKPPPRPAGPGQPAAQPRRRRARRSAALRAGKLGQASVPPEGRRSLWGLCAVRSSG